MAERGRGDARVIPLTSEARRKARRVTPNEVAARARAAQRRSQNRERGRQNRMATLERLPEGGGLVSGVMADPRLRRMAGFVRRRYAGEYVVDEYGFDEELTEEVLLPPLRALYRRYWRVEVRGMRHVPDEGPAVLACNHSGVVPWDAAMLLVALHDEHPAKPIVRIQGADGLMNMPVVSHLARKAANTVANEVDALRMLQEGEIVAAFPEGSRGLGKSFKDRYRLQRFRRNTFVEVALQTGAPIIPVGIVGAEETYPSITDVPVLARLFGLPYFALTANMPVPLPSKWIVEFGEPISTEAFGPDAESDAMTVFNIADGVRDIIQQILYRNLLQRRTWFW
ncbi:MAG: acyltransferase family protein [Acidimicrobiia bacterium]|nr:acyltransferase family protein [Acidimicrobiia bacterium]